MVNSIQSTRSARFILAHRMLTDEHGFNDLTRKIFGCSYKVANALGHGFVEKVYEHSLLHELGKRRIPVRQQEPIKVFYDGIIVGDFLADLIVENKVLVEVKASQSITNLHFAQCLNYLKACGMPICLLINFGTPAVQIKRIFNTFDSTPSAPIRDNPCNPC